MDSMKLNLVVGAMVVLVLALSACEPTMPEDVSQLPADVEQLVKEELSMETGIPVEEIEVLDAEYTEWPDACLGLAEPDEQCAQVITPGWRVTVRAEGQEYVVRTDEFGTTVRID